MISRWFAKLEGGETKEDRRQMVLSATPTLKILKNILEEDLASKRKLALDKAAYDKASWAYYQADAVGEQRVLQNVIELLDLTKES